MKTYISGQPVRRSKPILVRMPNDERQLYIATWTEDSIDGEPQVVRYVAGALAVAMGWWTRPSAYQRAQLIKYAKAAIDAVEHVHMCCEKGVPTKRSLQPDLQPHSRA